MKNKIVIMGAILLLGGCIKLTRDCNHKIIYYCEDNPKEICYEGCKYEK